MLMFMSMFMSYNLNGEVLLLRTSSMKLVTALSIMTNYNNSQVVDILITFGECGNVQEYQMNNIHMSSSKLHNFCLKLFSIPYHLLEI